MHDHGRLQQVIVAFFGSKQGEKRCGDPVFWDSAHTLTKFSYKLHIFKIQFTEGQSRVVLFSLNICVNAKERKHIVISLHSAFQQRFRMVVYTVGDDVMQLALSSIPYSEGTSMICVKII